MNKQPFPAPRTRSASARGRLSSSDSQSKNRSPFILRLIHSQLHKIHHGWSSCLVPGTLLGLAENFSKDLQRHPKPICMCCRAKCQTKDHTYISATRTFQHNRGKRGQPLKCLCRACASLLTGLCLCGGITQLVLRKQCEKENP